jgi:hypothetical protein
MVKVIVWEITQHGKMHVMKPISSRMQFGVALGYAAVLVFAAAALYSRHPLEPRPWPHLMAGAGTQSSISSSAAIPDPDRSWFGSLQSEAQYAYSRFLFGLA